VNCRIADPNSVRLTSNSAVGNRDIVTARSQIDARVHTQRNVGVAAGVPKECVSSGGYVQAAGGVAKECERSAGSVLPTGIVMDKRIYSSGRIVVCGVEVKRSSANGRVEAAGGVAPERHESDRCVEIARSET
jgi:hypothetical protein